MKQINSNKKSGKYQPYSYHDYVKAGYEDKSYKRLGGLGPNTGSAEWFEKQMKGE